MPEPFLAQETLLSERPQALTEKLPNVFDRALTHRCTSRRGMK
jgi:hypothetical protein